MHHGIAVTTFLSLYDDCPFQSAPDLPIHPNQNKITPSGIGERRKELLCGYYAAISAMDAGVGRILTNLDELGRREDTLVVFMSDNGMNLGHHGIWGKGNRTFPLNMYNTSAKFLLSLVMLVSFRRGRFLKLCSANTMCFQHYWSLSASEHQTTLLLYPGLALQIY